MADAPRGFREFPCRGEDGKGEDSCLIASERIAELHASGNRPKYLELYLIPQVMQNPTGIWRGLKREGLEAGICYAGRPAEVERKEDRSITVPCHPGKVFVVYLFGRRHTQGQLIVQDFEWVQADPHANEFPINHAGRFEQRLWPPLA